MVIVKGSERALAETSSIGGRAAPSKTASCSDEDVTVSVTVGANGHQNSPCDSPCDSPCNHPCDRPCDNP